MYHGAVDRDRTRGGEEARVNYREGRANGMGWRPAYRDRETASEDHTRGSAQYSKASAQAGS